MTKVYSTISGESWQVEAEYPDYVVIKSEDGTLFRLDRKLIRDGVYVIENS